MWIELLIDVCVMKVDFFFFCKFGFVCVIVKVCEWVVLFDCGLFMDVLLIEYCEEEVV